MISSSEETSGKDRSSRDPFSTNHTCHWGMCAEWGVGQGGIWEHRLTKEQKESREEHCQRDKAGRTVSPTKLRETRRLFTRPNARESFSRTGQFSWTDSRKPTSYSSYLLCEVTETRIPLQISGLRLTNYQMYIKGKYICMCIHTCFELGNCWVQGTADMDGWRYLYI